jgi:dihydrofolate reductase
LRKLKLQIQITVDGFVAGPQGELDWMTWNWDSKIINYVNELTDSVDTILLGRKMTDGFITYWSKLLNEPDDPEYEFAGKMIDYNKIVFSTTLDKSNWENTILAKGDLVDEINQLKNKEGKDIIVYGGANFVSSLIKNKLIDEYYLFLNPVAIGKGMEIFNSLENKLDLILTHSVPYDCGIIVNRFIPTMK